jgi:hypothetical protein
MDIKNNWIKVYIIDVLPCITISLYILALLYNISFFSVFHINILSFVSFTDLLLTIVEPLLLLSFTIFILFSIYFYANTLYVTDRKIYYLLQATYNPLLYAWFGFKFSYKIICKLLNSNKYTKSFVKRINNKFKPYFDSLKCWKEKNDNEENERLNNRDYKIFKDFVLFVTLMVLSYYVCSLILPYFKFEGMTKEVITLIFPIIICFYNFTFGKREIEPVDKIKSSIVIFITAYYIYAIIVFYLGGIDCANNYKDNNMVKFEINTNNGVCFNDSSYIYIEHLNNNYFLLEKKSNNVVVLNNTGISYSKLSFPNDERNSMIMYIFSKLND